MEPNPLGDASRAGGSRVRAGWLAGGVSVRVGDTTGRYRKMTETRRFTPDGRESC